MQRRKEQSVVIRERNPLLNEGISCERVKVIADDKSILGVMFTEDALKIAKQKSLDLFLVAPDAEMPVAKLMDYNRHQFELRKKKKQNKQNQKKQELKELKVLLNIQENDYQIKIKRARDFLAEKDRVRFLIRLRGRELSCVPLIKKLCTRIKEDLKDCSLLDTDVVISNDFSKLKNSYFLIFCPPK